MLIEYLYENMQIFKRVLKLCNGKQEKIRWKTVASNVFERKVCIVPDEENRTTNSAFEQ